MKELLQEISNLKGNNRSAAIDLWMKKLASTRHGATQSSDVDELVKFGESRPNAVQFFQNLSDLGAGRFISGRKGKRSRIEWGPCDATEIAKAYLHLTPNHSNIKSDCVNEPESQPEPTNVEATLIEHRYQLRPDLVIAISLPSNFSTHEAQRLSDYIRTLPFKA